MAMQLIAYLDLKFFTDSQRPPEDRVGDGQGSSQQVAIVPESDGVGRHVAADHVQPAVRGMARAAALARGKMDRAMVAADLFAADIEDIAVDETLRQQARQIGGQCFTLQKADILALFRVGQGQPGHLGADLVDGQGRDRENDFFQRVRPDHGQEIDLRFAPVGVLA